MKLGSWDIAFHHNPNDLYIGLFRDPRRGRAFLMLLSVGVKIVYREFPTIEATTILESQQSTLNEARTCPRCGRDTLGAGVGLIECKHAECSWRMYDAGIAGIHLRTGTAINPDTARIVLRRVKEVLTCHGCGIYGVAVGEACRQCDRINLYSYRGLLMPDCPNCGSNEWVAHANEDGATGPFDPKDWFCSMCSVCFDPHCTPESGPSGIVETRTGKEADGDQT